MNPQKHYGILSIVGPMILMLTTSGCATKKYVGQQVTPVSQRVDTLETQTAQKFVAAEEKIAAVSAKHEHDTSRLDERISTTDLKLGQTASATQEAQATASRAADEARANSGKIAGNSTAITTLASGVADALNYKIVENTDVTFGFDKYTLTSESKAALDLVVSKVQAQPRAIVELVGFTDTIGSPDYNLSLSRRRAEAVQRYLVTQKIPLRAITMVGLGEEAPPQGLEADLTNANPNPSKADVDRLARRVHVRVFGAGNIPQGSVATASAAQ